jgi:zinc transport system substrate-binding protein
VVSIPPQEYFAERIGGDLVSVTSMVKAGNSPHTYEPTPQQVADLAQTKLFFTIGMPYERKLREKISGTLKNLKIIDTSDSIEFIPSEEIHRHNNESYHHSQAELDPHIWLDPIRVKTQAKIIFEALSQADSSHKTQYWENLNLLLQGLDSLDLSIKEKLSPYKGREFFIFHPSLGYFCQRYGLAQRAIEIEGKEPGARQMKDLLEEMQRIGAKSILVQEEFSTKMAEALAQKIEGKVLKIRTLDANYPAMMTDITNKIILAIQ